MSMMSLRRRGAGKSLPYQIVEFNDRKYYTQQLVNDEYLPILETNSTMLCMVIKLPKEIHVENLQISIGGNIANAGVRFFAYDDDNSMVYRHVYSPANRIIEKSADIRTMYITAYRISKETSYVLDVDTGKYLFDGSTFNWSKYMG